MYKSLHMSLFHLCKIGRVPYAPRLISFNAGRPMLSYTDAGLRPHSMWQRKREFYNKRAHKSLGRSPEEKVKGHSRAIYRGPQGHNLNNFGRWPLDDAIYQIWKLSAL